MPRRTKVTPQGFKAAPGRPHSNVGKYVLRPTDRGNTGFDVLNVTPQVMQDVKTKYLTGYELPPGLRPKGLQQPSVLAKQKAAAISKGFVKPKSHQG